MKKILLFAALLGFIQSVTYGQLRFGITGALQTSKLHASASGFSLNTSDIFGAHIGGVAERAVNDNFFIQPGLLVSFKGGSYNSYKTSLTYLEIPILALYKYEVGSGKLVGGIGPYLGVLIAGQDDDEPIDVGKDVSRFDAGLKFSGGYELTESKLAFNLFYNAGLANINPNSLAKLRNSTIGLSVTYFFGGQ